MKDKDKDKDKSGTEIAVRPQSSARYIAWVHAGRAMEQKLRRDLIALYDHLCAGRASGIWREGPWHSFEEAIDRDFGWLPEHFRNFEELMRRYGRDKLAEVGYERLVPLARLPSGSDGERTVLAYIANGTEERGGRPPGVEAIRRVVAGFAPPAQPVGARESEKARLRQHIRELQAENTELRRKLAAAEKTIEKLTRKRAARAPAPETRV